MHYHIERVAGAVSLLKTFSTFPTRQERTEAQACVEQELMSLDNFASSL